MNNTLKAVALSTILALPSVSFAKPGDAKGAKDAKGPGGRMDGRRGPGRGPGRGMGGMMRRMGDELGLTASQKTKLEAVMKDTGAKRRAIRENKSLSEDQKRAQMKANRTSTEAKMKAILTPAQRTKLTAMEAKMRERMREGGGQWGGPRGGGERGR